MSAFLKEVQDLEETLRQINIEKCNLIEHLKKQDESFNAVIKDLQSVYTAKVEKLQLEVAKLTGALTKIEGEEEEAMQVLKLE